MNLAAFVAEYGLLAIAADCYLEGESVLLLGGLGAQQGLLPLPAVIGAGVAGAVFGDQLYFHIGRRVGLPALAARPRLERFVRAASRWIDERGAWFLVGFRFLYGMRIVSPLLLGTGSVSLARFSAWNLLGATVWASAVTMFGYLLGDTVSSGSAVVSACEAALLLAVVVGAVWWWRRTSRTASAGDAALSAAGTSRSRTARTQSGTRTSRRERSRASSA